jgi:signal transduction histidine kinase/CheY-like chemotaxis protein
VTSFLAGGGVTGDLIAALDWSKTPVGPMASWPVSLRTTVGTIVHSRHPMFLWWGEQLTQFYNDAYLPSFGVGKHPDAMGQAGRECWQEIWSIIGPQIEQVLTTGRATWNEDALVPILRNGKLEDVYWTYGYSPVRDDEDRIAGVLVVCTENTARVVAERRLEALVQRLEAADTAKDEFLATVSHELRSPLNAILGWTRMLSAGNVPPSKVAHAFQVVERNALAQAQLIEDLLDVSRIASGKLRLDVEPLSLPAVVDEAVESIRHTLATKEIQLEVRAAADDRTMMGDPHRLKQVIWNLLSNAAKFTPRGGSVSVTLETRGTSERIEVRDSGQGIPAELLGSIFDRFQQADGSVARVHGGLGLGLAICRHIVELHRGTIVASSDGLGRGATFTIELPASGVERPSKVVTSMIPPSRERPRELQGLTVLVVDDEADAREIIAEFLRQYGCSAILAASAQEALALLDESSPTIVLSDISMPGMDGYAFIEAVRTRRAEHGGRVVAVAVTALTRAEDRLRALKAGFDLHLSKPFDPAELVDVLRDAAQLALATS